MTRMATVLCRLVPGFFGVALGFRVWGTVACLGFVVARIITLQHAILKLGLISCWGGLGFGSRGLGVRIRRFGIVGFLRMEALVCGA